MQVESNHIQTSFCLSQCHKTAVLDFQILFSLFLQAHRNVLEMRIDLFTGDRLRDHTAFIDNRYRYLVIEGILQGILINQRAELGVGIFGRHNIALIVLGLLLHQRGACKGNLDSVG